MPRADHLGITISLVMISLVLSALVPLPSRDFHLVVLGSELTLRFSSAVQLALVMTTLVCAGVDVIMRGHPLVAQRALVYTVTFWVLPSLLAVTGLVLLQNLSWWGYRIALIWLVGILLALVMVSQYRSINPQDTAHRSARLALNVIVYVAALALYNSLYEVRYRSIVSATGALVASSLLALEMLRSDEASIARTWFYAALTGLLMGELTWALNYCRVDARLGGALQLLAFYVLTGVMQQHLWQRLSRHAVIEYALVSAAGFLALMGLLR
jgi:hypothetical protein